MMSSPTHGSGSMQVNCATSMWKHQKILPDMHKLGLDEGWQGMGSHNLGVQKLEKEWSCILQLKGLLQTS